MKYLEENEARNSFCSISGSWGLIVKSQHNDGSVITLEFKQDVKLLQGSIRQGSALQSAHHKLTLKHGIGSYENRNFYSKFFLSLSQPLR